MKLLGLVTEHTTVIFKSIILIIKYMVAYSGNKSAEHKKNKNNINKQIHNLCQTLISKLKVYRLESTK